MKTGFPRPWSEEYSVPTPYTSESTRAPGVGNDGRNAECIKLGLCSVCGLKLDEQMYIFVMNDSYGTVADPGLAHEKCATIMAKFCPAFKESQNTLVKVQTAPVLSIYQDHYSDWTTNIGAGDKVSLSSFKDHIIKPH